MNLDEEERRLNIEEEQQSQNERVLQSEDDSYFLHDPHDTLRWPEPPTPDQLGIATIGPPQEPIHEKLMQTRSWDDEAESRKRRTRMQRFGSWSALVVPSKRRKEIAGDFLESIKSAREQGIGWFGRWMLIAAKCLLYAWVVLKLRIGDLAQPSEDAESPESSD